MTDTTTTVGVVVESPSGAASDPTGGLPLGLQASSFLQAGWRPLLGWICVIALVYHLLARPIADWFVVNMLHLGALEPLDTSTLFIVLGTALGVGALRTVEKLNSAQNAPAS